MTPVVLALITNENRRGVLCAGIIWKSNSRISSLPQTMRQSLVQPGTKEAAGLLTSSSMALSNSAPQTTGSSLTMPQQSLLENKPLQTITASPLTRPEDSLYRDISKTSSFAIGDEEKFLEFANMHFDGDERLAKEALKMWGGDLDSAMKGLTGEDLDALWEKPRESVLRQAITRPVEYIKSLWERDNTFFGRMAVVAVRVVPIVLVWTVVFIITLAYSGATTAAQDVASDHRDQGDKTKDNLKVPSEKELKQIIAEKGTPEEEKANAFTLLGISSLRERNIQRV